MLSTISSLRSFFGIFFICIAVLLVVLGSFMLGGFFTDERKPSAEMVAFNSLSQEEQSLMISPKDSSVQKVVVDEELGESLGKEHLGNTVYAVTFHHTETADSGNLIVFLDEEKEKVLGKGFDGKQIERGQDG